MCRSSAYLARASKQENIMTTRPLFPLILIFALATAGCDSGAMSRGPLGKSDNIGSCEGSCGGQSDGSCFCDDLCESFGDCCGDYEQVCLGGQQFDCQPTDAVQLVSTLASDDPCFAWVDSEYGRVARAAPGSASIWSRRNEFGLGLLAGAAHTRGEGFFGSGGSDIDEFVSAPVAFTASSFIKLPLDDGTTYKTLSNGVFMIYHPEIPAAESGNKLLNIKPRHDFYLAVVDSQELQADMGQLMGDIVLDELPLRDPEELTTTAPTIADAVPGEPALLIGYPNVGTAPDRLSYSVGRILDSAETAQVMLELAAAGDEEGDLPFEEEVEFFMEGAALVGMSGGPVFDTDGRQIGIMVRATTADLGGKQYVRAVRMSYAISALLEAADTLAPAVQTELRRFLEP
jgi:hypothetical protein